MYKEKSQIICWISIIESQVGRWKSEANTSTKKSQKLIFMKWRVRTMKLVLVRHSSSSPIMLYCLIKVMWVIMSKYQERKRKSLWPIHIKGVSSLTNQPLPENYLHHPSKSTREAPFSRYFLLFPNGDSSGPTWKRTHLVF